MEGERIQPDLKTLTSSLFRHPTTNVSATLAFGDTAVRATMQPLPRQTSRLRREKEATQINIQRRLLLGT